MQLEENHSKSSDLLLEHVSDWLQWLLHEKVRVEIEPPVMHQQRSPDQVRYTRGVPTCRSPCVMDVCM